MRAFAIANAALFVLATSCAAAPRSFVVDHEELGPVEILAPTDEPTRFAIFISDADGLTGQRRQEAEALVTRGAVAALIDLKQLQAKLAVSDEETCLYTFGDFEDLAHVAQRRLGMSRWRWPIMFGIGEGGTLAYLTLAQAPFNTAGGAVSIGFTPKFAGTKPICPGAPKQSEGGGVITYAPFSDVPGPWTLVTATQPSTETRAFLDAADNATLKVVAGDHHAQFEAATEALFAMPAPSTEGLSDLPLVELPATGEPRAVMILISGDGGWRDIDKEIGEYLSKQGVAVVGVDSLRYFWSRKDAGQIATDLDRIAAHYASKWNNSRIALGGYSFGADVLPIAWPKLSRETRDRTVLIALLGLEPTIDLEISVSGFLGLASDRDVDVRPHLSALPRERTLCFYGADEKKDGDTACLAKELAGASQIERPGGHHFDGDYEAIAKIILDRLPAPAAASATDPPHRD